MTTGSPIDVLLRATWIVGVGYRYDVILDGKTIVRRSRDPEHDAARALLSRGLRGTFRTVDFTTGKPRMILDIAKAGRLRVVERVDGGLTLARHSPMSPAAKAALRPHTSHRGGVFGDGMGHEPLSPPEASGGGGCADKSTGVVGGATFAWEDRVSDLAAADFEDA